MVSLISQTLLYFFGPFFCYPWKPIINAITGESYETSYRYFRRDHSDATNLALHSICLVFQLLGNFILLDTIDGHLCSTTWAHCMAYSFTRPISLLSVLAWSATVVTAPSPPVVTALSLASLWAAYTTAPLVPGRLLEAVVVISFSVTLVAGLLFLSPPKGKPSAKRFSVVKGFVTALGWLSWLAVWWTVERHYGGSFAAHSTEINLALVVVMLAVSAGPKVPEGPAIIGGLLCRLVAALTGQPLIFLWGTAFTAPLLQGTSHRATGEVATLINHNRPDAIRELKVKAEWAHVTFFPSLAFHSIYDSWNQK